MALIIRHPEDFAFNHSIDQSDVNFYTKVIDHLIHENIVLLPQSGRRVEVIEHGRGKYRGLRARYLRPFQRKEGQWESQTQKTGTTSPSGE